MACIWIVNPFDPLPGEAERPGRYASLARLLRDAGHEVVWWTASFSHRFKKPRNGALIRQICAQEGIDARLVDTRPYPQNFSLHRLRSHADYASHFAREAAQAPSPAVIIASNPPLRAPAAAARVAQTHNARLIIDVQDIWIDTFRKRIPRPLRWTWPIAFAPFIRDNRFAYAAADAVVGVAGRYADEPRRYRRAEYDRFVIPLGIDLPSFDDDANRGRCLIGEKPAEQTWVMYSGSYSAGYDVITVAHTAVRLVTERPNVRFILSGRGALQDEVRRIIAGVERITLLGFVDATDWAATLRQCDIGWNAVHPEMLIFLPNKVFDYWAAGLAVLNSIPGECADLLTETQTGRSYTAGDVDSACASLGELLDDHDALMGMGAASRQLAENRWDRRILYRPYVDLVEQLASHAEQPPKRKNGPCAS